MTTLFKRQQSRRRLAAINFLSNISLDGSHRDTKLGLVINPRDNKNCLKPPIGKPRHSSDPSDEPEEPLYVRRNSVVLPIGRQEHYTDPKNAHARVTSPFDKTPHDAESRTRYISKKNKSHSNKPCFGSDESIEDQNLGIGGSTPEVQFLKSPRDLVREEKFHSASGKKGTVAGNINRRHGSQKESKQEQNKKRHMSGNKMSHVSEDPDPLDLLGLMGIEKPPDGQDISFAQLLLPSSARTSSHGSRRLDVTGSLASHDEESEFRDDPSPQFSSRPIRISHHRLPSGTSCSPPPFFSGDESKDHPKHSSGAVYHPNLLDDPELTVAGTKQVSSHVASYPSYIASIMDYVKPPDLKKELNEKFRERFPTVQLTLSKMRSLKKEMCKIAYHECGIDLLTVAQAYVYFEKLILKRLVNKSNRKLCAGSCLILSAKLNDVKGNDMKNLLEKIESGFRLNKKELLSVEFGVLVALEFSLLLPVSQILPHYQRLTESLQD